MPKELVKRGPSGVATSHGTAKREQNDAKPTTTRALVLRNGKYGARGTGELVLVSKISGREKLDLLAEDLISKTKKAVVRPFRLETCTKIAESQLVSFLDEIKSLQDPELFQFIIEKECAARTPARKKAGGPDPMRNPSYIASVVATRIHNAYMQASAWKNVCESLQELEEQVPDDSKMKQELGIDKNLRARYLALYDMVNHLANANQVKVSVLATTTAHYSSYFKRAEDPQFSDADADFVFDWDAVREACKSFLDSIVIELCFPGASYPRHLLFQILRDSIEESPKEAKRFPQTLWDAVGDLSETVDLLELLERPLSGPKGEQWKQESRQKSVRYEKWVDAQLFSEKAADIYANYKDTIYPLEKTKKRHVLENMWKYINLNYKSVSGMDMDTLWQLDDVLQRAPRWHSFYIPGAGNDLDSDRELPPHLGKKGKKRLAITNGPVDSDESPCSMPDLQSVSDSEQTEDDDSDDSSDDEDGDIKDDDVESEYDEEYEDGLREMRREAMDIVATIPEFFDHTKPLPEHFAQLEEERKGNPFLKLLGSLRGRMFSSNPKMKTSRTEPGQPASAPASRSGGDEVPPLESVKAPKMKGAKATQAPQSRKPTVEDAEDEDDVVQAPAKKKKRRRKKKPAVAQPELEVVAEHPDPSVPSLPVPSSPPIAKVSPPKPTKKPVPTSPKSPQLDAPSVNASNISLPLPTSQTTAQSSRAYLQAENLTEPKAKVKTRPGHSTMFTVAEKSRGFFSKFGGKKDKDKAGDEGEEKKGSKHSWFSKLGKKTKGYMHQLLRTSEDEKKGSGSMKWEEFLKVMREMGFKYDPSTAGSSVRFDPPDSRDVSITFHKPHPDSTLYPHMLRDFGKRLRRAYGWCEEDFLQ